MPKIKYDEDVKRIVDSIVKIDENIYVDIDTSEMYETQDDYEKAVSKKIALFMYKTKEEISKATKEYHKNFEDIIGMKNKNSKVPKKETALFNVAIREAIMMKHEIGLDKWDKLVFYVLCDLISFPSNMVVLNDDVPLLKDLEPILDMKERKISECLKNLESRKLIIRKYIGVKRAIFVNPYIYRGSVSMDKITPSTIKLFSINIKPQE